MASVSVTRIARAALVQTAREFLLLPFWWYSAGLLKMIELVRGSIRDVSKTLGLGVWVKNLFVPMYGDETFVGRMISFGIRLFVIVFRGIAVALWAALVSLGFLAYTFALPFLVVVFLIQVFGVLFG